MANDETFLASRRLLAVTEEELSRIVLDIHDGPVQYLFASLSLLASLQRKIESYDDTPAPLTADLLPTVQRINTLLEDALSEIRSFLGTFRPPGFQRRPLASILQGMIFQHEERTGHTVDLDVALKSDDAPLPVKIAMYRILQEALSNAHRHAGVPHQTVRLWDEGDLICLSVIDEGKGFVPPPLEGPTATEREEHIGLRGMRDRVKLLGGTFSLTSTPGKGTSITVKVPQTGREREPIWLSVFE